MATITANQQASYLAQATDAARILADKLHALSPAEQAAILATVAASINCPIDVVMPTDETSDGPEAAAILDGVLTRIRDERYAWDIGSGCSIQIQTLPKETR